MLFSAGMNYVVSRLLFKVGKDTNSMALLADGWHLRTDVWTSLGVFGGLAVIWIGRFLFPSVNLAWIDPVAAIGVALLILKAAYDLTIESGRDLLDVSLSAEEEAWIRDMIAAHCPRVCGYHRLRTRRAGPVRFIEFHLLVDPKMTVERSHRITIEMTKAVEERFPNASVTIHIEPCDGSCGPVCLAGCFLSPDARGVRRASQ